MLRASIATMGTSALLALVALVNTSITARGLGVEGRGLLASALLLAAIARGLALMGLGEAFVYHGRAGRLGNRPAKYLTVALLSVVLAGAALTACGIPLSPVSGVMVVAMLAVTLGGLGSGADLLIASARMQRELSTFNWLRMVSPTLGTTVVLALWTFSSLSVETVLIAMTSATLAAVVLGGVAMSRFLASPMRVAEPVPILTVPAFLRSGVGYQGIAMLGLTLNYAHMFIVMSIGSLAVFGVYSAAYGLSRMIAPIQMSLGSVVYARTAGASGGGPAAMRLFRLTFLPLVAAASIGAALAPWIVTILLGHAFSAAALPFGVLLVEAVVSGAAFILGQHLTAAGHVALVLARNSLSAVPLLLGVFLLNEGNVAVGMAFLLLASASARLFATLFAYRRQFGPGSMRLIPTVHDLRALNSVLRRSP